MEKTSISKEETKNISSQFNNYKTILNNRDLGESRSFFKENKESTSTDKRLTNCNYLVQEKRISNMVAVQGEAARSSSAIKKKRGSNSLVQKRPPILKFKNLLTPTTELISQLLYRNKDERYRYLIKNAVVHYVEKVTDTIYVELPQIPNILIIYRKPDIRVKSQDSLALDDRGLSHIPLLEGEEKLSKFVLKRNKISKLENLVSLPNLESLDLSYNVLREITNLNTLEKLRHLNLKNNIIDSIYGLGLLQSLETIDISSNKIKKIERLEKCINLKIINLSSNFICVFEGLSNLASLEDLDLSNNKIAMIKDTRGLISVRRINLANNFIENGLEKIKNLDRVTEFWIENNPICRKADFFKSLKKLIPKLVVYNGKKPILPKEINGDEIDSGVEVPVKVNQVVVPQSENSKENNNVIRIIRKEWEKEVERLKCNLKFYEEGKSKGVKNERCYVQSGHAEIESNKMLFIYGNAMEVLKRSEFYTVVEEMYLECVRFDHIVHYSNLDKIKKFTNLKKFYLSYNNLNSFILLSKLECLQSIENLIIENNDLLNCSMLKSFVVYRFQHLTYFNSVKITDKDKEEAKQSFQIFDSILSRCMRMYVHNLICFRPISIRIQPHLSDPVKKHEFKQQQKKNAEVSHNYVNNLLNHIIEINENEEEIHDDCESAMINVIRDTVEESLDY